MDSHGPWLVFCNIEKFFYDVVGRRGAVDEVKVRMIYPISDKFIFVVLGLVESDYTRYVEVLEDLQVVFGSVTPPLVFADVVEWAHERYEFIRYDPVQVTVLDFLVVFVLLVVEFPELVPSQSNGVLQSLQTMKNRARIAALQGI